MTRRGVCTGSYFVSCLIASIYCCRQERAPLQARYGEGTFVARSLGGALDDPQHPVRPNCDHRGDLPGVGCHTEMGK